MEASKIHVLLIEDDPMVQEINREFVEKSDLFTVVGAACNGQQGLTAIEELKPELVLLDIFMPTLNGIETLRKIREQFAVDVIVISAANDIKTIQQVLHLGAVDYIIKPFTFERLKRALEGYFALKAGLHKNSSISQRDLDELRYGGQLAPERPTGGQNLLPKGLNESTLRVILAFLDTQNSEVSAEEVAEGVGLARVTARRYLEYLETIGEVQLHVRYGSIGRPVNRYNRATRPKRPK